MKTHGLIFLLAICLFSCTTKKDDITPSNPNQNNTNSLSKDAGLKSLTVSVGVWSTIFVSDTLNYVINESNSVSNVDVSLEANNEKAKIVVNNESLSSYKGSKNLTLVVGDNLYKIIVTAEDGKTQKTYNVNIKRKALLIPSATKSINVKADVTNNKFIITWNKSVNAETYKLMSKIGTSNTFGLVADNLADTTYTYTCSSIGTEYTFQVIAINKDGQSINNPEAKNWITFIYAEQNDKDTQLNYPGFLNNNAPNHSPEIVSGQSTQKQHGWVSGKYDYWSRFNTNNNDGDYYQIFLKNGDNLKIVMNGSYESVNFYVNKKSSSGSYMLAGYSWSQAYNQTYLMNGFTGATSSDTYDTYVVVGTKSGQSYDFTFEITRN
jgi:hypothetical protein